MKTFYNKLRLLLSILRQEDKIKLSHEEFSKELLETVVRINAFNILIIERRP